MQQLLHALVRDRTVCAPDKPASKEMRHFRALIDRRDQLREDEIREQNRLEACRDAWTIKDLKQMIRLIQKHIKAIEQEIDLIADSTVEIREARQVMTKAFWRSLRLPLMYLLPTSLN